ncbi:hypothetical protein FQA39_LY15043 [Lamprigera yunnana]|nr:hypothetical protein FQA39_LY15043 [Lamprigera yunnana]
MNKMDFQLSDTHINISFGSTWKKFYYIWLRDNCRCQKCYSTIYNQLLHAIFDIPLTIKPENCEIVNGILKITWEGGHQSEYLITWLENIDFECKSKLEVTLWDHDTIINSLDDLTVPLDEYFGENGVKTLVGKILKYGFAFVSGVDKTLTATEKVVKHLAVIQKTSFGEMWYVNYDHNDSSSSNISLLPHNDNTYYSNPAGLQVFNLIMHDGDGGETILVDGFKLADIVKNKSFKAFRTLCEVPVEAHYIDKDQHFIFTEPILKLHPVTKELYRVRFNIYDRGPLTSVKDDAILRFYEALELFGKEVSDEKNQYTFKLPSNTIIFIDNWRVLHGRTGFNGKRNLGGCYVGRDDFISVAKRFFPHIQ